MSNASSQQDIPLVRGGSPLVDASQIGMRKESRHVVIHVMQIPVDQVCNNIFTTNKTCHTLTLGAY